MTLQIDDTGAVSFNDRIVGEFDGSVLTLNAAWCRLAGLGIKVDGDTTDRRRVLLDRSDVGATKTPKVDPAQTQIPLDTDKGDPELPEQTPVKGGHPARLDPEPEPEEPGGVPEDPWAKDPAYDDDPSGDDELPVEDPPEDAVPPNIRGRMAGTSHDF